MRWALTWAGLTLLAFVLRLTSTPWDLGGFMFRLCFGVAGVLFFAAAYHRLNSSARSLTLTTILPIGVFVLFGSIWFAPQSLLPFMFVALVLGGVAVLWSMSRSRSAFILSLIMLPLVVYCFYGAGQIRDVLSLRFLAAEDVAELRFSPATGEGEKVVVSRPEAVAEVVTALHHTTPYGPSHEGIERPWTLTIGYRDGTSRDVAIGDGNRENPSFVWVKLGASVYQNPDLREALRKAGVEPW